MPKDYKKYLTPEAIKRHREYVMTKIDCPACSHEVMRCNMSKHRTSKIHKAFLETNPDWKPEPKQKTSIKTQLADALKKLGELEIVLKRK